LPTQYSNADVKARSHGPDILAEKMMYRETLFGLIDERLDQEDVSIPIFNKVAIEMQQLITKGDYSLEDISRIIRKDPGLAADVLKIANSSFYSGLNPARTINEAAVRLGARTIFNLVTAVTQKQLYRSRKKAFDRWMNPLWSHALGVAFASGWTSRQLGMNQLIEESFMAGLLHDVGKLVVLRIIEDLEDSLPDGGQDSEELVKEALDRLHTIHGERAMRTMNMPDVYCRVVGMHHDEDASGERDVLAVVRLVNLTCQNIGIGLKRNPDLNLLATPEARTLKAGQPMLDEMGSKLQEYMSLMPHLSCCAP
jgi:HD-like signal output (HDOD) protein